MASIKFLLSGAAALQPTEDLLPRRQRIVTDIVSRVCLSLPALHQIAPKLLRSSGRIFQAELPSRQVNWTSAPSHLHCHPDHLLPLSITTIVTCLCMMEDVANILELKVAIVKHKSGVSTSVLKDDSPSFFFIIIILLSLFFTLKMQKCSHPVARQHQRFIIRTT